MSLERLDAFMARANAAYYATHDPFADFTTSPEISQVFGEILGLWAAVAWRLIGSPNQVLLVEAGPGRGTLMADALRAIRQVAPAFHASLRLHLIETSLRLRVEQAKRLPVAIWHDSLDSVPPGPMLLLANEFLDALPIRQFVRQAEGWTERFVGPHGAMDRATRESPADWGWDIAPTEEGSVLELCEPARAFAAALADRFHAHPGAALLLDYGSERSTPGDSLQALAGGKPADPFSPPGSADLTAHVDFAALARMARAHGAAVQGPVPQGPFLARLGLFQRTNRLARGQTPARAAALVEAAQRLAEPDRMGRLFKALALAHPGCPPLPGFEA